MKFYKYQGAGNDFLIADNRDGAISEADGVLYFMEGGRRRSIRISDVCDRRYGVGADGLMLLEISDVNDFRMTYFNSDGSGGMMCGNGGRCMVAFAADMGIQHFDFDAADGFHTAEILSSDGPLKTVRLRMKDVDRAQEYVSLTGVEAPSDGYFLDTGTRHFVRHVIGLDEYDVVGEGRDLRWNAAELKPIGANVNFVEAFDGSIMVRTYEKGVEDETFACGTGIVASAVASYLKGIPPTSVGSDGRISYSVHAKRDELAVDFLPSESAAAYTQVWLTGPAVFVAEILLCGI